MTKAVYSLINCVVRLSLFIYKASGFHSGCFWTQKGEIRKWLTLRIETLRACIKTVNKFSLISMETVVLRCQFSSFRVSLSIRMLEIVFQTGANNKTWRAWMTVTSQIITVNLFALYIYWRKPKWQQGEIMLKGKRVITIPKINANNKIKNCFGY